MRLLFILFCCPFFSMAQSGRPDDSLRKVSDTMHFPKPFMFKMSAATALSPDAIMERSYAWLTAVKDSLKGIVIAKDETHKKVSATNVPATADISYTLQIHAKDSGYVCTLQDYIFHSINGKQVPVDKAIMIKYYKRTTNIERVIIMRNHQNIFDSLNLYLEKPN